MTTVQSSSSTSVSYVPSVSIGSIASTDPTTSSRSLAGCTFVGQERLHVHFAADAVAAVAVDDAVGTTVQLLGGVRAVLDRVRDVGETVARQHRRDTGLHRQPRRLAQIGVGLR